MPKAREVAKALERCGWVVVRERGSHKQFAKGDQRRTFAYHDTRELGTVQLRQVAAEFVLTLEELRKALKLPCCEAPGWQSPAG